MKNEEIEAASLSMSEAEKPEAEATVMVLLLIADELCSIRKIMEEHFLPKVHDYYLNKHGKWTMVDPENPPHADDHWIEPDKVPETDPTPSGRG